MDALDMSVILQGRDTPGAAGSSTQRATSHRAFAPHRTHSLFQEFLGVLRRKGRGDQCLLDMTPP